MKKEEGAGNPQPSMNGYNCAREMTIDKVPSCLKIMTDSKVVARFWIIVKVL